MNRTSVRDPQNGEVVGWFDADEARLLMSRHARCHGQNLYQTAGGKLVLWSYSCVSGERDCAEIITLADAAKLFAAYEPCRDAPACLQEAVASQEL